MDTAKRYKALMIGLILELDLSFYENVDQRQHAKQTILDTYYYGRQEGVAVTGYWYQIFQQIIGTKPHAFLSGYKTCPAEGCKISVEPSGDVFICKCCSQPLGHISDLKSVLCSSRYEAYALQAYRNAPECAGCSIEGFCSGPCMGAREKKYGRIDKIEDNACSIYREITRALIETVSPTEVDMLTLMHT